MSESICQSCGMDMKSAEEFGTNADLSQNAEYCTYCFKDGVFTRNVTMEASDDLFPLKINILLNYLIIKNIT